MRQTGYFSMVELVLAVILHPLGTLVLEVLGRTDYQLKQLCPHMVYSFGQHQSSRSYILYNSANTKQ